MVTTLLGIGCLTLAAIAYWAQRTTADTTRKGYVWEWTGFADRRDYVAHTAPTSEAQWDRLFGRV